MLDWINLFLIDQHALLRESKLTKEKSIAKSKNSRLAPDPKPAPPPADPVSAINVIILFDVADDVCLKRSAGRYGESL